VAISGRTPHECYEEFRQHVASLVAATLSRTEVIKVTVAGPTATLGFARSPIQLDGSRGPIYFSLAQLLDTERNPKTKRQELRTRKYWYHLKDTRDGEAAIRWEYDPAVMPRCRNHVQFSGPAFVFAGAPLDLKHLHLPTGWVLMEEVFRFLISELGVRAPCGEGWSDELRKYARKFRQTFTDRPV
jgi:hypothetical protein